MIFGIIFKQCIKNVMKIFSCFDKLLFSSQEWVFSDGLSTGKRRVYACSSTLLTMVCIIIIRNTYVKGILEQTCALYNQLQNMKKKWQYFPWFAKLWDLAYFGYVIDEQLLDNDDLNQYLCDRHYLYTVLLRFYFDTRRLENWSKLRTDIWQYQI